MGTPFVDCQRCKGGGTDCGQFIAAVFENAQVFPSIPTAAYSPQWHLHHSEELYMQSILRYCREITEDEVKPGDIVLYFCGKCYSHGAIVLEWPTQIIHAVKLMRGVVYSDPVRDRFLVGRKRKFFSPWNDDGRLAGGAS
jgi:cell wall-associated NlpC family hydrolase